MNNISILGIIDDNEIYCYLLKRVILQADFVQTAMFFENGQVALDYITEFKDQSEKLPDLILLDINMPILDGWQFMDEFVKISPVIDKKIPVFITSSSIDDDDHTRAASIPEVSDFYTKPINRAILREIVSKI